MSLSKRAFALILAALLVVAVAVAGSAASPSRSGHHGHHGNKHHHKGKHHKHHKSKAPKSFFGIDPQAPLQGSDYKKMKQAKVKTLRTGLYWPSAEPSKGNYNFSLFDQYVLGAAKKGITVLPYLYGTPDWVANDLDGRSCYQSECTKYAPQHKAALNAWRDFARQAAARYGRHGSFWREHHGIPKKKIRNWQIWNEQNSKTFYLPKPNPKKYYKLLKKAKQGLKSKDHKAHLILGGMFGLPGKSKAIAASTFIHKLLKIPGAKHKFDGYALHPYSTGLSFVKKQVKVARKELKRSHYPGADLWITETGAASGRGARPSPLNLHSKKRQAKRVSQTYKLFEQHRKQWNVKLVTWFAWEDSHASDEVCSYCAKAGLIKENGKKKPSWHAYKRVAKKR